MVKLKRSPLLGICPEKASRFELEVESKLGYKVAKTQRTDREKEAEVKAALDELGLAPFTQDSVDRYKRDKRIAGFLAFFGACFLLSALSGIVCGLSGLVMWLCCLAFGGEITSSVYLVWSGASGAVLMLAIVGIVLSPNREWRQKRLDGYDKPVPEYVLQTALDLKARLPSCTLYVDEITVARRVDPFLVLRYWSKDYFVEVWNEPGFKQKREW